MNAPNNNRRVQYDREKNDHYVEPAWCADLIFASGMIADGPVWDPACGFGTIVDAARRAGRAAFGTDLVNRGSPLQLERHNFFSDDWAGPPRCTMTDVAIVSNPPFNIALEWAIRALDLDIGPVALIVQLRFLAGLTRAHLYEAYPPAFEAVFSDRPSMPPGGAIGDMGDAAFSGGTIDFACIVWNAERTGPTVARKLYRKPQFDRVRGRYEAARTRVSAWAQGDSA